MADTCIACCSQQVGGGAAKERKNGEGALLTSMTTAAPSSAWARPAPVSASMPVLGEREAMTTSWPSASKRLARGRPISPVPPIMTIFMSHVSNAGLCLHDEMAADDVT